MKKFEFKYSVVIMGAALLSVNACGKPAEPVAAPPPTTMAPVATTVAPEPSADALDLLKDNTGWNNYMETDAVNTVTASTGEKGQTLELSYDMKKDRWVGMSKPVGKDLSAYKGVKFMYKGEGGTNRLEFKIEDKDGSNFGVTQVANVSTWTPVEFMFENAPNMYLWGGDKSLDLKEVLLHWAVSKQLPTDQGGVGKVWIAQLELIQ